MRDWGGEGGGGCGVSNVLFSATLNKLLNYTPPPHPLHVKRQNSCAPKRKITKLNRKKVPKSIKNDL